MNKEKPDFMQLPPYGVPGKPYAVDPLYLNARYNYQFDAAQSAGPVFQAFSAGSPGAARGAIAVLKITGTIQCNDSWSFWTGQAKPGIISLTQKIRALASDPSYIGVVVICDSPGGECAGLSELANEIRAARAVKPVIGFVSGYCASAAYWILSQCTKIVALRNTIVGSVGVYCIHSDVSEMLKNDGVTITEIYAGENKLAASSYKTLEKNAKEMLQAVVDSSYQNFLSDVAQGRKISTSQALEASAGGKIFAAEDAQTRGLIDEIGTLDEIYKNLGVEVKQDGGQNALFPAPAFFSDLSAPPPPLPAPPPPVPPPAPPPAAAEKIDGAEIEEMRKNCKKHLETKGF